MNKFFWVSKIILSLTDPKQTITNELRYMNELENYTTVGDYQKWAVSGCPNLEADRVEYIIFSQIKPYIIGKLITQGIQIF